MVAWGTSRQCVAPGRWDTACPISGQGDQILDTPGRRVPLVRRGDAEKCPWHTPCLGGHRPGRRTVSLAARVANQRLGAPVGVGQGDTVRTPTVDVAATDRGASCHAKKGNRGRKWRVGRREEEEERRNFTAPTMDQGWQASQLGAEVCLASFRPPTRVRLSHGNPLSGPRPQNPWPRSWRASPLLGGVVVRLRHRVLTWSAVVLNSPARRCGDERTRRLELPRPPVWQRAHPPS
jgi:hypothetical protein